MSELNKNRLIYIATAMSITLLLILTIYFSQNVIIIYDTEKVINTMNKENITDTERVNKNNKNKLSLWNNTNYERIIYLDTERVNKKNKNKTVGLIIRSCWDLYESLMAAYNLQRLDVNIPITIFWLDSHHQKFDYFIDEMNKYMINNNKGIKFEKLKLFGFQVPFRFIKPLKSNWYGVAWNKLTLWNKTNYDTIIYLDNDILITRPISELFELTVNGFTYHSDRNGYSSMLNGGVIVIKPNIKMVKYFVNFGKQHINERDIFSISEQSFLQNILFHSINTTNYPFIMLSSIYNSIARFCNVFKEDDINNDLVKIWHFAAQNHKPLHWININQKNNINISIDYDLFNKEMIRTGKCAKSLNKKWMIQFIDTYSKYIKPVYNKCLAIKNQIDNFVFLNISIKKLPKH